MKIKSKIIKFTIYLSVILGVISCLKKEDPTPSSPSPSSPTPSSPTPSSPSPSSPTPSSPLPSTSTRTVTFWNPISSGYGTVKVTLGSLSNTITLDASDPDCGTTGCANFYGVSKSTLYYYAEEINGTATWSGTIPSGSASCFAMKLY